MKFRSKFFCIIFACLIACFSFVIISSDNKVNADVVSDKNYQIIDFLPTNDIMIFNSVPPSLNNLFNFEGIPFAILYTDNGPIIQGVSASINRGSAGQINRTFNFYSTSATTHTTTLYLYYISSYTSQSSLYYNTIICSLEYSFLGTYNSDMQLTRITYLSSNYTAAVNIPFLSNLQFGISCRFEDSNSNVYTIDMLIKNTSNYYYTMHYFGKQDFNVPSTYVTNSYNLGFTEGKSEGIKIADSRVNTSSSSYTQGFNVGDATGYARGVQASMGGNTLSFIVERVFNLVPETFKSIFNINIPVLNINIFELITGLVFLGISIYLVKLFL